MLVLACMSTPVLARGCFSAKIPPPAFSKEGSTTLATYTVTGSINGLTIGQNCVLDLRPWVGSSSNFGYQFMFNSFKYTDISSDLATCTSNITVNGFLAFTQNAVGACAISFKAVYPFTGSYNGNKPLTDIILEPMGIVRSSATGNTFGFVFFNKIKVPPSSAPIPEPTPTKCSVLLSSKVIK
jgi:hypothetical protein